MFFWPKFETKTLSYYFSKPLSFPAKSAISRACLHSRLLWSKSKYRLFIPSRPLLPAPIYQSLWPGLINIQWRSWFQRWKEYSCDDDLVENIESEIVLSVDAERDLQLVDRSQLGDQLLHLLPRWRQVQTGDKVVSKLSPRYLKVVSKLSPSCLNVVS